MKLATVKLLISSLLRSAAYVFAIVVVLTCTDVVGFATDIHLTVPFKSQVPPGTWKSTNNCGQTCVLMVLAYHKSPPATPTEDDIKAVDDWLLEHLGDPVKNYNGSNTGTSRLVTLAREYGGMADSSSYSNWTMQDLQNELSQGRPVIVAVWTNMKVGKPNRQHFMVLIGMDDSNVYLNDPGHTRGANATYPITEFQTAWANQHSSVVVIRPTSSNRCDSFLSFVTGSPAGPGDGVFVQSGGPFGDEFEFSSPIPLAGITDGFSFSVWLPPDVPMDPQLVGISYNISAVNRPAQCHTGFGGGTNGLLIFNGVRGVFNSVSQSDLQFALDDLNDPNMGCDVGIDDLFITSVIVVNFTHSPSSRVSPKVIMLPIVRTLDAANFCPGRSNHPSAARANNEFPGKAVSQSSIGQSHYLKTR